MRLHRLSLTAFGPFPGTEDVDFDSLNAAGLFLLSGATGAGKTSILDAVCFALYGSVPGARGVKVLKSQHADDRVGPEVVLDFSVRDRRFVVRRSPQWSRPKLRGSGKRTEKASASLSEITADGERLVSHRAAEVGLAISELVGMQAAQFQQVAMLPQGEFQRFLQATSADRHDVLQHLFRTARFARIEDWVSEHSRRLRSESATGEQTVRTLLATIADRAGSVLPEQLLAHPDGEAAVRWAREQLALSEGELGAAVGRHAAATARVRTCRLAVDRLRRRAELTRRRDDARARLATLAAGAADVDELRSRLHTAAAAERCLPVVDLLDRAVSEAARTAADRDDVLDRLRRSAEDVDLPDGEPSAESLAEVERCTVAMLARLEHALPTLRALQADRAALAAAEADLEQAEAEQAQLVQERDALPVRRQALAEQLTAVRAIAATADALQLRLEAARGRLEASRTVTEARRRLAAEQDTLRDARDSAADARERVQTLLQRRLDGYAAELAGVLREGSPCQVCGSTHHPAPAVASVDHVGAEEQHAAQEVLDATLADVESVTAEVNRLDQAIAELERRAEGRDVDTAAVEHAAAEQQLAGARAAAEQLTDMENALADHDVRVQRCHARAGEVDLRVARLGEAVRSRRRAIEDAWTAITDVFPAGGEAADLTRHCALLTTRLQTVRSLRSAQSRHDDASARVAELEAEAVSAATAAGFEQPADVRSALLDEAEQDRLRALLEERTAAATAAAAVLAEPDVVALGDDPLPDLAGAETALSDADVELREAARGMHQLEQRAAALRTQTHRLEEELADWGPSLREAERAEAMSKLVRGMGGDNQLQMRLSAYVLATRLDQVLAAANERLSHMRDQRYVLQRTARAHRKGTQAGLGLEMLDQWTGDTRDPATLSGGETFVVSLALALGLADVVSQEAGGAEIETLFVDEGFGALDADTLDDVMDRLDALRAGGRSVGVVSHVTELRTRIPTQLHVRKTPTGSSIRVS